MGNQAHFWVKESSSFFHNFFILCRSCPVGAICPLSSVHLLFLRTAFLFSFYYLAVSTLLSFLIHFNIFTSFNMSANLLIFRLSFLVKLRIFFFKKIVKNHLLTINFPRTHFLFNHQKVLKQMLCIYVSSTTSCSSLGTI